MRAASFEDLGAELQTDSVEDLEEELQTARQKLRSK
jgi:hypothetical protein